MATNFKIPKHELEALGRCFLPDIIAFFESDEGKKEYEEWETEQEKSESTPPYKTA